jgi:Protein of unknown function (DUF992)
MYRMVTMAAIMTLGVVQAEAQEARVHVGVLTCTASDKVEPGSAAGLETVPMTCGFKPAESGVEERYLGSLHQRASAGASAAGKRVFVWAVVGPKNRKVGPGLLAQEYALGRPSGNKAPSALIGAKDQSIALQPETTNEVSAITGIELKLTTTPA